jgi:transcription termination factor Rho
MDTQRTVRLSMDHYLSMIRKLRTVLNAIETEERARSLFDRLMQTESGNKMLLDAFCESPDPVKWWEIYYGEWC